MSNIFKFHRRTMKAAVTMLRNIGEPMDANNTAKGYYAGKILVSGTEYELIISSKVSGGQSTKQWTSNINNDLLTNKYDGLFNTDNIKNYNGNNLNMAADWCRSLSLGGYSDWYLPSKNESEFLYRTFKPTDAANGSYSISNNTSIPPYNNNYGTTFPATNPSKTSISLFQAGNSEAFNTSKYWTSTQFSTANAFATSFSDGGQYGNLTKTNNYIARAVRKKIVN